MLEVVAVEMVATEIHLKELLKLHRDQQTLVVREADPVAETQDHMMLQDGKEEMVVQV
jgi:hypothetical protein